MKQSMASYYRGEKYSRRRYIFTYLLIFLIVIAFKTNQNYVTAWSCVPAYNCRRLSLSHSWGHESCNCHRLNLDTSKKSSITTRSITSFSRSRRTSSISSSSLLLAMSNNKHNYLPNLSTIQNTIKKSTIHSFPGNKHQKKLTGSQPSSIAIIFPFFTAIYLAWQAGKMIYKFCKYSNNYKSNNVSLNHKRQKQQSLSWWTDHPAFQRLSAWAFDTCAQTVVPSDPTANDTTCPLTDTHVKMDRSQVYIGILLVHLHLAQYVGVAACHPPTHQQVNQFINEATSSSSSSSSSSNYVDRSQFTDILIWSMAHLTSRIMVYYTMLFVVGVIPLVTKFTIPLFHQSEIFYSSKAASLAAVLAERLFSLGLLVGIVPILFNILDKFSHRLLKPKHNMNHGMQI